MVALARDVSPDELRRLARQPKSELGKYPCGECGWMVAPVEYHPIAACALVKMTGRDPMPNLQAVAEDFETRAYRTLRYLWTADVERDATGGTVRDLFTPGDPLVEEIERLVR